MGSLPVRDTFGLMPPGTDVLIYLVFAPFAVVFLYGVYRRLRVYGASRLVSLSLGGGGGLGDLLRYAWGQGRVVRDAAAGAMHVPLMYGAFILFIGTVLVFIDQDILRPFGSRLLAGDPYLLYEVVLDLFGLLFLWGVVAALWRRLGGRLRRLREKTEYYASLATLFFVGITGYLIEGLRLYLKPIGWGGFSFIGELSAGYMRAASLDLGAAALAYQALWWSHAVASFALIAAIPYTVLVHIFTGPLNIAASHLRPASPMLPATTFRLTEIDESQAGELKVGIRRISEMSWLQRLGLDACTDCGRCEAECPAHAGGTPLSPRMVVQKLRDEMWGAMLRDGEEREFFEGGVLTAQEVWACTTCGACVEACPVLISPLEYILEARRSLTMEGRLDKRMVDTLMNLARTQNPYGLPPARREELVRELRELGAKTIEERPGAEYVYWLGCMAAYDERSREVAKRLVEIMVRAGVDFALLGSREVCSGDPARRMGEEGRYQELAYTNIETFREMGVKKIITHCPHCYNILKNEYRDLGVELEVIHHSILLARLRAEGRISPREGAALTLHDSCYMSRVNGVIEEPRAALLGTDLREMRRRGRRSFCCGAGGGNYWYEVKRETRESWIRLDEAIETGAETMVVECPFCLAMFEDAIRARGLSDKIRVRDISEIF